MNNTILLAREIRVYIFLTCLVICGLAGSLITAPKIVHFGINFPFSNIVFSILTYPIIDCICELSTAPIISIVNFFEYAKCDKTFGIFLIRLDFLGLSVKVRYSCNFSGGCPCRFCSVRQHWLFVALAFAS